MDNNRLAKVAKNGTTGLRKVSARVGYDHDETFG